MAKILKEVEGKKYSYACLMLKINFPKWESFCNKFIDKDDVYEDENLGIETNPHITILYGLHYPECKLETIQSLIPNDLKGIECTLTNISMFRNDNNNYDVIKFDVESQQLKKLNLIYRTLPHTNSFPDYHPHLTIFYGKRGVAEKYLHTDFDKITVKSKEFVYSTPEGKKYNFSL